MFTKTALALVAATALAACAQSRQPDLLDQIAALDGIRPQPQPPHLAITQIGTHPQNVVIIQQSREHVLINAGQQTIPDTWHDVAAGTYVTSCTQ